MNRAGAPLPYLEEWFVAFVDYGCNLWWHRFCRKGFRHVFAFAYDPSAGVWILFDPTLEGFVLRALPGHAIDRMVAEIWSRDGRILRARAQGKAPARPRLFATCVTVIAHLLGLRRAPLRPDGLHALLLKHGARPAFDKDEAAGAPTTNP